MEWINELPEAAGMPIIMMSGVKRDISSIKKAKQLWIDKYLAKPFDLKTIDIGGPAAGSTMEAFFINFLLLAIFGVQHSVMARPGFKKRLTAIIPKNLERPILRVSGSGPA